MGPCACSFAAGDGHAVRNAAAADVRVSARHTRTVVPAPGVPKHPIQGTACVMMTVAIVSGLLLADRETHGVYEPSSTFSYALTEKFSIEDLAAGDRSAEGSLP